MLQTVSLLNWIIELWHRFICKTSLTDKSFDDEDSVDGNRPSSASSAFKVPAPKKPGNPSNPSRKPGSAGGPKVGGKFKLFKLTFAGFIWLFLFASTRLTKIRLKNFER